MGGLGMQSVVWRGGRKAMLRDVGLAIPSGAFGTLPGRSAREAMRRAIVDHLHALCERSDVVVLWARHLVDEVRATDRVVVLHQGRVTARGRAPGVVAGTGASNLATEFVRRTRGEPAEAVAQ